MQIIQRIISIIGLGVIWTTGPWFVALVWCCFHIVWFRGIEVIFVALAVDVFYKTTDVLPWYTLAAVCGLVLYEWLRSQFFIYNR